MLTLASKHHPSNSANSSQGINNAVHGWEQNEIDCGLDDVTLRKISSYARQEFSFNDRIVRGSY